jgi:hypothetical protein
LREGKGREGVGWIWRLDMFLNKGFQQLN